MPEVNDKAANQTSERESTSSSAQRWVLPLAFLIFGLIGGGILMRLLWPAQKPVTPIAEKAEPAKAAPEQDNNRVELNAEALAHARIETVAVTTKSISEPLAATGRLTINENAAARIGSPVEGRISRALVNVGDYVRSGQPVVLVHSHELAQAQADYAKARANITRLEKALAYAQAEKARADRLLAAKALSAREQMRAEADVNTATIELEQAKTELERADEFLHHLGVKDIKQEDVVIASPINGYVLKRDITIGTVVNPATDLLTIANLSTLWAIAEVPERLAASVHTGQQVRLTVAAFGEQTFTGRVTHIAETLNPETRTMQVRCQVENPGGKLRPEMFVNVHIETKPSAPMPVIPHDAVQEVKGERVVFVPINQNVFEKKSIQTGRELGDWVEVVSGLNEGQRVVTRGAFFIKSAFLKSSMSEE